MFCLKVGRDASINLKLDMLMSNDVILITFLQPTVTCMSQDIKIGQRWRRKVWRFGIQYLEVHISFQNAFRQGNLSSVNLLALDALLTIINEVETHSHATCQVAGTENSIATTEKERTISVSSETTGINIFLVFFLSLNYHQENKEIND